MKKITLPFTALIFLCMIYSCASGGNTNRTSPVPPAEQTSIPDTAKILARIAGGSNITGDDVEIHFELSQDLSHPDKKKEFTLREIRLNETGLYLISADQKESWLLPSAGLTLQRVSQYPEKHVPSLKHENRILTLPQAGAEPAILVQDISQDNSRELPIPCATGLRVPPGFISRGLLLAPQNTSELAVYSSDGESSIVLTSAPLQDIAFSEDFLVTLDDNNLCTFWLLEDLEAQSTPPEPHLRFYADTPADWVLWNRDGHYLAAGRGSEFLRVQQSGKTEDTSADLPAATLAAQLNRPGYLARLLKGESYAAAGKTQEKELPVKTLARIFPAENWYLTDTAENWDFISHITLTDDTATTIYINYPEECSTNVVTTKSPVPFPLTPLSQFLDDTLKNYKKTFMDFKHLSRQPLTHAGKNGLLERFRATTLGLSMEWYCWVGFSGSHYYNITGWSRITGSSPDSIPAEILTFFDSFQFYTPPQTASIKEYQSPHFGYSFDLRDSEWQIWPQAQQYHEQAEIGVHMGTPTILLVTPLYTGLNTPSLDSLAQAYLSLMKSDDEDTPIREYRKLTENELDGAEFFVEAKEKYFLRIWRGKQHAYFLNVLPEQDKEIGFDQAREVMDKFSAGHPPEAAPDYSSFPADLSTKMSLLLNETGIYYYNHDQSLKAARFFELAHEAAGKNPTIFENYLYSISYAEAYDEGLAYLEQHLGDYKDNLNFFSFKAYFLKNTGENSQAREVYETLFSRGYTNDYDFDDYLTLLWDMDLYEEAFTVLEKYKQDPQPLHLIRREADFRSRLEEFEAAIALLRQAYLSNTFDEDLVLDLSYTYNQAGRYQDAVDLCAEVLQEDHISAAIYLEKAINEGNLGWYKAARLSLEKALELDPNNNEIQNQLDFITGLLGQGDNSLFRTEIEAVPVEKNQLPLDPPPSSETFTSGDAYYRYKVVAISYRKDRAYKISRYYRIKILTNTGIATFSTFDLNFEPDVEGIYVNSLKVYDADGNLKTTGNPDTYYVVDDTSEQMATNAKVLNIPIPGLQPGSEIELVATWKKHSTGESFTFFTDFLNRIHPMQHSYLTIRGDIDQLAYTQQNLSAPEKKPEILSWHCADQPGFTWENFTPPVETYLPVVYVGENGHTWEEEAASYLEEIKEKLEPPPAIRELAAELCEGIADDEIKAATLARYVQTNITYKAIEFGRRAWIPNDGETILHNKYGDCKDMALLLHLLLKGTGIPSSLTLINSTELIATEVPDLDQMNHMILYLPEYRNGFYFDPTNKTYDIANLIPENLGKRHALILDPAGPHMEVLPDYDPDSCAFTSKRHVQINKEGKVSVSENIRFDGYMASWVRLYLQQFDQAQRQPNLQNYLAGSGTSINLEKLEIANLNDPAHPLILELTYSLNKGFIRLQDQLIGEIPAIWERIFTFVPHAPSRKAPIHLSYASAFSSQVSVSAPEGMQFQELPPTIKEENKYVYWSIARGNSGDELQLDCSFSSKPGTHPPGEFTDFTDAMNGVLGEMEKGVVLK